MAEVLNERKYKILKAIIQNYLDTGEPVGSRTISKYTDLNLSSATIRNEMADLEEMGYIVQPHTSAGRIPTDKGYRFYVDELIEGKEEEIAETNEIVIHKQDKIDRMLKQVAKVLANNTNYAAMISSPAFHRSKIKFIQLSQIDKFQVMAIVVIEGNVVKNKVLTVREEIDAETVLKLNMLLNTNLNGLTLDEISLGTITQMKDQAGDYAELVESVIDAVVQTVKEDEEYEIYTSGATNIFRYPELSNQKNASALISTFEEKQQLRSIVSRSMEDGEQENGIQVYIGDESPFNDMKDCSVVTATYDLGNDMKGTVGIIGPKRMDYENVMNTMNKLLKQLDQISKNNKS